MNRDDLRAEIRQILIEELAALKAETALQPQTQSTNEGRAPRDAETGAFAATTPRPQVREESVTLSNDRDLALFVERLLAIASDGRAVAEIKAGRWVFKLRPAPASGVASAVHSPMSVPKLPIQTAAAQRPATNPPSRASVTPAVCIDKGLVAERQVAALPANSRLQVGPRVRFTPLALDMLRQRKISIERVKP